MGWRGLVHCSQPSCQGKTPKKTSRGAGPLHQENLVQPGQRIQACKLELCWDKAPPLPLEKRSHGGINLLLFFVPTGYALGQFLLILGYHVVLEIALQPPTYKTCEQFGAWFQDLLITE